MGEDVEETFKNQIYKKINTNLITENCKTIKN